MNKWQISEGLKTELEKAIALECETRFGIQNPPVLYAVEGADGLNVKIGVIANSLKVTVEFSFPDVDQKKHLKLWDDYLQSIAKNCDQGTEDPRLD